MTNPNTPAPAMQKLKPCPFCGGPVDLENTVDGRSWWGVICRNTRNLGGTCAVQIRPSASKEAAITRWNMRAPVADERAARAEYDRGYSNGWDYGNKHGREQGFNGGVCVALQVITTHDQGTIWSDIVRACDMRKMLDYAANVEPDEWELAGFKKYARLELNERKPRKRHVPASPLASAPVAAQEFKAAFPNGALSAAKYHELWERASKGGNTTYTLLENMSWYIARFGELVAEEVAASAPVAGEALNDLQALQWAEKYGIQWALSTPDAIREVIADAQRLVVPQASEAVRDAEAWLIEWKPGDGNTWVEADANEVRAHDKAQRINGTVTPMVRAALSAQPGAQKEQPDPQWMTCEKRGWMVRESLARNAKGMRADEKRCRNAYNEEYMGAPTRYLADVFAEAAAVFEARLKELPPQKKRAE